MARECVVNRSRELYHSVQNGHPCDLNRIIQTRELSAEVDDDDDDDDDGRCL